MGYVYTPQEWEEGKFGSSSAFQSAVPIIKNDLSKIHADGLIEGAIICGSVLHGEGGPGSDIDAVVIFQEDDLEREAEGRLWTVYNETLEAGIPVEWIPVQSYKFQEGHDISLYYFMYLRDFCKEGFVGNDPISWIASKDEWKNPVKEVRKDLQRKIKQLKDKNMSTSREFTDEHCDFLERIIRQPIYTAIDLLRTKTDGNYPAENGKPLSKEKCCHLFKDEFDGMGRDELFNVLGMRKEYRRFLQEPRHDTAAYIRLLKEIERAYPDAIGFMEKSHRYLITLS